MATVTGIASWYGHEYAGRLMANGHPFDPAAMTAACWDYPLGAVLIVKNVDNGRAVRVTVTDRGPAMAYRDAGRVIDLSRAAFAAIGDTAKGLMRVVVTPATAATSPGL